MKYAAHISAAAVACSIGAVFLTHAAAGQARPGAPAPSMNFFVTSNGLGDGANLAMLSNWKYRRLFNLRIYSQYFHSSDRANSTCTTASKTTR